MSLSGSILLLLVPLIGAAVVWLLGRWPRLAVAVGVAAAWGLALWLGLLPDESGPALVLGRALTLTPGIQFLFVWLLVVLGLLFLLSLVWPQGGFFIPASLAAVSPLAAVLLVRPLTLGALFWLLAAVFLGIVIQSDQAGRTQAAWRYVLMMFLAVLLLLAGGRMAETAQMALQELAGQLLTVVFLIVMAGFPFHIWLQPIVSAERYYLPLVLVIGIGQLILTMFVYDWLAAYPWIQTAVFFHQIVQWSSGLTALTAGVLAVAMPSLRRLVGSLLLLDMSVSLALLLVPAGEGWETAVLLPLLRTASLLLIVTGWSNLAGAGPARPGDGPAWPGAGRRRPVAALTVGYGLVSLLGLPLAVGFPGRWAAIALIAGVPGVSFWLPASLLLAMGGGIYGVWRGLAPLLRRGETAVDAPAAVTKRFTAVQAGLLLGLAAGMVLAVTPLGLTFVQRLAAGWLRAG